MNPSTSPTTVRSRRLLVTTDMVPRLDLILLGCILVGVVLLRLPGQVLPLERDEGAYAYVASAWLQGGLPYRDAFDHKPPLIYLLYMPPLLTPLPPHVAIRLWSTALCLLNAGLVFIIGRHLWRPGIALLATLVFGVAGSAFDLQGLILNTDQALVLPALLVLWSAIQLDKTQRLRFAVVLGAAVAAALFVKPVALVLGLLVLLVSLGQPGNAAKVLGGVALGVAVVTAPIMVYFWAMGGWDDLLLAVITYNRLYAGEARERWQLGPLVDMFVPFIPLLVSAAGGVVLLRMQPLQAWRAGWLTIAWTAALLAAALGSLRAFIHYYYPILPGLALLAAPSICWLWVQGAGATRLQRISGRIAPMLLASFLVVPLAVQNLKLVGTTAEQQATRLYGDAGQHYFAAAPQVADYVRKQTQPDDYIYVFAAEPQVYVLSQRRAASRYIYDYPLGLLPQAAAELRHNLAVKPPKLVITYVGVRPELLASDPYLVTLSKLTQIGGYEIFGKE